jgi:hypothetical protein
MGVVAPIVFVVVVLVLTVRERRFLSESGWSPVRRSHVEWPSLLALGPGGGVLIGTFIAVGCCSLLLAYAYMAWAPNGINQLAGGGLAVMAVGLLCVAFRADQPLALQQSWHGAVHNRGYFLIPLGGLLCLALLATAAARNEMRRTARILLLYTLVGFALTNVTSIAQLARYVAFSGLLIMVMSVGRTLVWASAQEGTAD